MRKPTRNEAIVLYDGFGFVQEYGHENPSIQAEEWWDETAQWIIDVLFAKSEEASVARAEQYVDENPLDFVRELRTKWKTKCEDEKPQLFRD